MADTSINGQTLPDSQSRRAVPPTALTSADWPERNTAGLLEARVLAVTAVTDQERQLLLRDKLTDSNLSPELRAAWIKLLSNPELQLLTLALADRRQYVLADRWVQPGQTLLLRMDQTGQLRLLDLPATPTVATTPPHTAAAGKPTALPVGTEPGQTELRQALQASLLRQAGAAPEQQSRPPITPLVPNAPAARPIAEFHTRLDQHLRTLLADSVRLSLPLARSPAELFRSASQLAAAAERVVMTRGATPVTDALSPALKALLATPVEWSDWKARPVDSLMLATQRFGLANSAAAESDYRQALNHLAAALASPALSHSATAPGADSALGDALWQVFKQARHNSAANQEPSAREQIQQQLKQLTEAALAQLTVHRSRGLLSSSPSAPLTQQLHLADLPIRFGDHTYGNVLLQIQELAINEGRQQKSRRDKRRKAKWTAYMELTLEDESGLAVEMSLMDRTLDATFWCGTEALQQQSTQGLEQLKMALQADGIDVADLRCVAKAPPPKAHALTVSLIDTQG